MIVLYTYFPIASIYKLFKNPITYFNECLQVSILYKKRVKHEIVYDLELEYE